MNHRLARNHDIAAVETTKYTLRCILGGKIAQLCESQSYILPISRVAAINARP
jgi:hypothetical protein